MLGLSVDTQTRTMTSATAPSLRPAGSNPDHGPCHNAIPEAVSASVWASACPTQRLEPSQHADSVRASSLLPEPSPADGHACTLEQECFELPGMTELAKELAVRLPA